MNRQILPTERQALACQAKDSRLALTDYPLGAERLFFVVRARFVGKLPQRIAMFTEDRDLYLGKRGQWCSKVKALRFHTHAAAERALHEKWTRLRETGNRSVILSIIQSALPVSDSAH